MCLFIHIQNDNQSVLMSAVICGSYLMFLSTLPHIYKINMHHSFIHFACIMMLLGILVASWTYHEFFIDIPSFGGDGNKKQEEEQKNDEGKESISSTFGSMSSFGGDKDGATLKRNVSIPNRSISDGHILRKNTFSQESIDTKIARIKSTVNDESVKKDVLEVIKFQHMFGFATPCIAGKVVGNDTPTKTTCNVTTDHLIWSNSAQSPEECFATLIPIVEARRCDMKQKLK